MAQQRGPRIAQARRDVRRHAPVARGVGGIAAQVRHQRAHEGAQGRMERQHAQRRVIAGCGQPCAEQPMRAVRATVGGEIHDREREIAGDVDPAQRVVELDAVEHQQPVAPADQVVQMQIAVAGAHEAVRAALVELRREARQRRLAPRAQRGLGRHGGVERIGERPPLGHHAGRAAVACARCAAGRVQVIVREARRQRVGVRETVVAAGAACGEHRTRIEAAHAHRVFQRAGRRRLAAACRRARDGAEDAAPAPRDERPYAQIERPGQRAVERALGLRAAAAPREPREIGEVELHRLEKLVSVASSEKYHRQVRLDAPDAARGMRVGACAAQGAIDAAGVAARLAAA
ncbi:hypothetical protein PWP93_20860 [Paraburkholderia sp. A1RI-2L]|uniref:hypothetical protein n=1 Tax=Paraburkholderia sp. A1RI-2L TaxID=3028367 RepID=UPI003B7964D2